MDHLIAIRSRMGIDFCLFLGVVMLAGCVQTSWREGTGPSSVLATSDQMMDVEQADRVARFHRLADMNGIAAPRIEPLVVPAAAVPGSSRPIPVIRVTFAEQDFFAPGEAQPRPSASRILSVIAENMRHDVPDLRVTLLGHTDATGTDSGNLALSQQRALAALEILVQDGVNPGQLGTVAIGMAQPIASNATPAGRASNRRIELLISPSEEANIRAVQSRHVDRAFFRLASDATALGHAGGPASVEFLKPRYSGPADFSEAAPVDRKIRLAEVRNLPLRSASGETDDTGSPVSRAAANVAKAEEETGSPVAAAP